MTLTSHLADLTFPSFAYNACGVNDEVFSQLKKVAESESAAVLLKSVSLEPRKGNEPPKYILKSALLPGGTLNSIGLSNRGLEENLQYVEDLKKITNKPIFVSLTNFSNEENYQLLEAFLKQNLVSGIELNISCPNVESKGLLGYYPELVDKYLGGVDKISAGSKVLIGLKLPPYLEDVYFDSMSEVLVNHKVDFIVCTNTLGNALVIDPQKESVAIKPNFGRGGLAGDYLKPISLSNVNSFYRRIGDRIGIVGVGGVRTGRDAFEYLLAGANCVQVGTALAENGYSIFEKIHTELAGILEEKGYSSASEARGKLKFL